MTVYIDLWERHQYFLVIHSASMWPGVVIGSRKLDTESDGLSLLIKETVLNKFVFIYFNASEGG